MDAPHPVPAATIVASYEELRRRGTSTRSRAAGAVDEPLYSLRPGAIWRFLVTQPASYWLICAYLFLEYVRPQGVYPALAAVPLAQITLILALGAFVFLEGGRFRLGTPADALLGVFTAVLLLSSLAAQRPEVAFGKVGYFFNWVLIYLLIVGIVSTEKRFLVFVFSFLLYSFKMSQHGTRSWASEGFAFRDWGTVSGSGWFANSGEFGIQMCVFLPMVVFFISALNAHWGKVAKALCWTMALTAVVGIVASSSRGAVVGLGATALWMAMKSRHRGKAVLGTTFLAVFVFYILPPEQKERFRTAGEDQTSQSREAYWRHGREIMERYPVLGIGYANWPDYHEANYGVRALPHNVFIEAGAEMGYLGLGAFVALIGATLVVNRRTRKIAMSLPGGGNRFLHDSAHGLDGALVGFLASGFFVTVLYYPFFWINLALTVALHHATVDARGKAAREGPAPDASAPLPAVLAVPRRAVGRGGGWG